MSRLLSRSYIALIISLKRDDLRPGTYHPLIAPTSVPLATQYQRPAASAVLGSYSATEGTPESEGKTPLILA